MAGRKPKVSKSEYINNRQFYEEIVGYFKAKENDPETPIPECLWIKFKILANRIANSGKYSLGFALVNKEDIISESICLCAIKIDLFDPTRSRNPFSYFTTTIENSFRGDINKEIINNHKKDRCLKLYEEKVDMIDSGQYFIASNTYCGM